MDGKRVLRIPVVRRRSGRGAPALARGPRTGMVACRDGRTGTRTTGDPPAPSKRALICAFLRQLRGNGSGGLGLSLIRDPAKPGPEIFSAYITQPPRQAAFNCRDCQLRSRVTSADSPPSLVSCANTLRIIRSDELMNSLKVVTREREKVRR